MQYIEVKNLEKYHPGYKDRSLQWCKIYFTMLNADPEVELLCEVDRWRLVAFIMLQLQIKRSIPLNPIYLKRKGFDLKKRPIQLTLNMLHNFLNIVTEDDSVTQLSKDCNDSVTESRVDKSRVDKDTTTQIKDLLAQFPNHFHKDIETYWDRARRNNKSGVMTEGRKLTMLTELYNSMERCDDENIFTYALEQAIIRDAACIGYINKVWANKKTKRPL